MIDYGVKINVGGNAPTVMGQLFTISQKLDAIMQKLNSMSSKLGDTFRRTGTSAQQATQKAESGFKRVSTAIGDARQKLDKLNFGFHGLGSKLAGLGLSIGAVDIGRRIINAGGNEEDILARLEFALKDRGKAIAMNSELKAFARRTPIPIQDMRQQAAMLAPVFGDQTMKYFKMLGDVVSGSGGDFGNIAYNFAQIKSMGRTYGIDLRQFAMQNIPIWQELAKVLNVPVEKMEEISTSGKITFDVVAKAFENMTKEGGIYFGAMEARAHTFRGQWQIIGNKMQEIWVKFFEKARPYLQQFSDWVEKQIESFDEWWPKLQFWGELAVKIGAVVLAFKTLAGVIGIAKIAMTAFTVAANLNPIILALGTVAASVGAIYIGLERSVNLMQRLGEGEYASMSSESLNRLKESTISDIGETQDELDDYGYKNRTTFGRLFFMNVHKKQKLDTRLTDLRARLDAINHVLFKRENSSDNINTSQTSYTPGQAISAVNTDLSPRGVSGNGGIKNFQITFNSPVVQVDDNHVEGEKYTPEQLGQIAGKEFVNILTQIAVH